MKKQLTMLLWLIKIFTAGSNAQQPVSKSLGAKRISSAIKIDGKLDEATWKETVPATDFVEWRPNFGGKEENETRTEVYLLYDNTAIYVGGYCHEKSKDSVSKELVGRDK